MASAATAERVVLKQAIDDHAAAVAMAVAAQEAEHPLHQAVWAADAALEDARKALQGAKASAGDFALAVALGTAGERPTTLRDARNAVQECEDALEYARAARDAVEAKKPALQMVVGLALGRAQRARAAVIRAEARETAEALAVELKQRQAAVCETAALLHWLVGQGALPLVEAHGHSFGKLADEKTRSLLDRVDVVSGRSKLAPWQQWSEVLLKDASAPMPEVVK